MLVNSAVEHSTHVPHRGGLGYDLQSEPLSPKVDGERNISFVQLNTIRAFHIAGKTNTVR